MPMMRIGILPCTVSYLSLLKFQIKKIKKRVREIVHLPEEEFNDLVSKARDYSLASAGIPLGKIIALKF